MPWSAEAVCASNVEREKKISEAVKTVTPARCTCTADLTSTFDAAHPALGGSSKRQSLHFGGGRQERGAG